MSSPSVCVCVYLWVSEYAFVFISLCGFISFFYVKTKLLFAGQVSSIIVIIEILTICSSLQTFLSTISQHQLAWPPLASPV